MSILFDQIVFGPIHSRRLGISLGMNLLPYDGKLCSFDCIYCECGYNADTRTKTVLPNREQVRDALDAKLKQLATENIIPDVITFAGNGEPTLHPEFAEIIDDTIELRDKYNLKAKISVLSNAAHLNKSKVLKALKRVENNILKLDSAFIETVRLMDCPNSPSYSIETQAGYFKEFDGNFILQTMFLRGEHNGIRIDNTTEKEISAWLDIIQETRPKEVMIYTIDRETPEKNLEKVSVEDLRKIASRVEALGIKVNIAG